MNEFDNDCSPLDLARLISSSISTQKELIKLWCGTSTGTPINPQRALRLLGEKYIDGPALKRAEIDYKRQVAQQQKTEALAKEKKRQNKLAEGKLIEKDVVEKFIAQKNKQVFAVLDTARSDMPDYGESERARVALAEYAETLSENVANALGSPLK